MALAMLIIAVAGFNDDLENAEIESLREVVHCLANFFENVVQYRGRDHWVRAGPIVS
ncbi:MAG: hypothetical protein ACE5JF_00290 [Anaerolineales bacterium]